MSKEEGIFAEYFAITKEYQEKYGKNTILLMQVGAFFEVYGLKTKEEQIIESEILNFSQICQLNISEKKIVYKSQQVLMAGFRDYSLDKYIQKITENGFSAVVFVQEKNEKNTKRIFHSVYSAGTFISYDTDSSPQITNHIMCVWLEKTKSILNKQPQIIVGISTVNIFTGKSYMFEYQTPFSINPTTFDELERFVSVFSPSEVIVISSFESQDIQTVLQFSNIRTNVIHNVDLREPKNEKALNCTKQKYVVHLLETFYEKDIYDVIQEFQTNVFATQSFCYLLNFIQEHNPNLVRKIDLPICNNTSNRCVLANHTLKQLNIIEENSDGKSFGILSSVLSFLNKTCSSMGKRLFQNLLLNPTFDEPWLNREYTVVDYLIEHKYLICDLRKLLVQVKDVEKICRQIIMKKIYPSSIYNLYKTLILCRELYNFIKVHPSLQNYLFYDNKRGNNDTPISFIENVASIVAFIEENLLIDECKSYNSLLSFDKNIICSGLSSNLDDAIRTCDENTKLFNELRDHLNKLLRIQEKTIDIEYVKEHETEKSGTSLQITKKRGAVLKTIFNSLSGSAEPYVELSNKTKIFYKDFKLVHASSSSDEIECPFLHKIIRDNLALKVNINKEIAIAYNSFIELLEQKWFSSLENIATYIAKLDVLQCKSYVAIENNYCRPVISGDEPKAFIRASKMRHVLIEHIQKNEVYVPNDVELGCKEEGKEGKDSQNGLLLFGINMSGKSSYIKSIGISLIMAQSGMFVPCSQFEYKPYQSIFSRINCSDNLFKNLSLFAVEMTELRMILKNSNENSMILVDELAVGTETQSSLSILMATLEELHKKESSFLFSTHFHEILDFDEMNLLTKMKVKHLHVFYDREQDCLIYERTLKNGSGNKSYGIEVCKSLYFQLDFLDRTMEIKNKYFKENSGVLSYEPSRYNSDKLKGLCEICKIHFSSDVHHIEEQKKGNESGFIDSFHKNHKANLMSICEKCHIKIHQEEHHLNVQESKSGLNFLDDNCSVLTEPTISPSLPKKKIVRKKKQAV
jgi:DNA mismatch repair protein MutS